MSGTSMTVVTRTRARSVSNICLAVARIGIAHEFFGHVFEIVVNIPDRCAKDQRPGAPDRRMPSLLSSGSPLRYFAPIAPITVAATIGALATSRRTEPNRALLAVAAGTLLGSDALTAYIVRVLNTRLFVAGRPITATEQDRMLRTWYRLNAVRVALCGIAWLAATIAREHRGSAL